MFERLLAIRRKILMQWRRLRYRLRHVHQTAYISYQTRVGSDLRMAEFSFINNNCVIDYNVEIGRYSMIGPYVSIVGGDHYFDEPGVPIVFSGRPEQPRTVIEDDVWVGAGAIIMAGTRIGRGSIVAAGCVVTKDVPPYEIHGGVTNKKLRDRFESEEERTIHDKMLQGPLVVGGQCETKRSRDAADGK